MTKSIASIYYFNYENEFGYYRSFRNFCLKRMVYMELALSTPTKKVFSTPNSFQISEENSTLIKDYINQRVDSLTEIDKPNNYNPPKYILICYTDGTDKYFEFDEDFCEILNSAKNYKLSDKTDDIVSSPFLVFEDNRSAKIATIIEQLDSLFRKKQLSKILTFLHEDCVLKIDSSDLSKSIISKKAIKDALKKESGFANSKLRKIKLYTMIEGYLQDGQSALGLSLEITDKNYNTKHYSLRFLFDDNFSIKTLTVYDSRFNIDSKLILRSDALQKIKEARYNDFIS